MNSTPSSAAPASPHGDYTGAFLLLRFFLGLRALLAGFEKWESSGTYSAENYLRNMSRLAEGITGASFLPLAMTRPFAFGLGYALVATGFALLLGLKTRLSLLAVGLIYVALAFGLMAVQESEGVAWLGVHVLMVAAALALVRHDRFALWK